MCFLTYVYQIHSEEVKNRTSSKNLVFVRLGQVLFSFSQVEPEEVDVEEEVVVFLEISEVLFFRSCWSFFRMFSSRS